MALYYLEILFRFPLVKPTLYMSSRLLRLRLCRQPAYLFSACDLLSMLVGGFHIEPCDFLLIRMFYSDFLWTASWLYSWPIGGGRQIQMFFFLTFLPVKSTVCPPIFQALEFRAEACQKPVQLRKQTTHPIFLRSLALVFELFLQFFHFQIGNRIVRYARNLRFPDACSTNAQNRTKLMSYPLQQPS